MIQTLFIVCASIGLAVCLLNLIGSSLYDVAETQRQKAYRDHPYAAAHRRRPLVSAVISAENDGETLYCCLNSLARSSYRNLEIIVIDHASRDNSQELVRQFQTGHPKLPIRLVARRTNADKEATVIKNIKRYAGGEYILRLSADSNLERLAIKLAVLRLNAASGAGRIQFRRRTLVNYRTVGLLQRYHELWQSSARKSLAYSGLARQTGLMPLMYRLSGAQTSTLYANDAIANVATASYVGLFKQDYLHKLSALQALTGLTAKFSNRSAGRLLIAIFFLAQFGLLLIPVFIGYFFYMAFHLHEPSFLILISAVMAVLLILAIWEDDQSIMQKLVYSLLSPVTFVIFYVLNLTRLLALARAIRRG